VNISVPSNDPLENHLKILLHTQHASKVLVDETAPSRPAALGLGRRSNLCTPETKRGLNVMDFVDGNNFKNQ
jgi:hypothetical protein